MIFIYLGLIFWQKVIKMSKSLTKISKNIMYNFNELDCLSNLLTLSNKNNFINHLVIIVNQDDVMKGKILDFSDKNEVILILKQNNEKIYLDPSNIYISWKEEPIKQKEINIKEEFVSGINSISNVAKTMIEHYLRLQNNSKITEEIRQKQKNLEESLKDLAQVTVTECAKVEPKIDKI